jgi:hypothetical protein
MKRNRLMAALVELGGDMIERSSTGRTKQLLGLSDEPEVRLVRKRFRLAGHGEGYGLANEARFHRLLRRREPGVLSFLGL